jgi:hypothetical protein
MFDFEHEIRELELADRHVRDGRERVRRQIAVVRELRDDGHDTELARKLLAVLRSSVAVTRQHRALMLEILADHNNRGGMAHAAPAQPRMEP